MVWRTRILVGHQMTYTTALMVGFKRYLHWLVSVNQVDDLHLQVTQVSRFLCHKDAASVFETLQRQDGIDQDNVAPISVQQFQFDCYRHLRLKARRILLDICAYFIIIVTTELSSLHCLSFTTATVRFLVVSLTLLSSVFSQMTLACTFQTKRNYNK